MREARFYGFTGDRLLYLWLHKLGLMGRSDMREVAGQIQVGTTVVDVGANVGLYTWLASRCVGPQGKVIALEPSLSNWQALSRAKQVNGWSNVEIHRVAAADRSGHMYLEQSSYNSGNNALAETSTAGSDAVEVIRLDDLLAGRKVDFIKIDVQGWEAAVLKGAGQTLSQNRPLCVRIEIWPTGLRRAGSSPDEVVALLGGAGLQIDRDDKVKLAGSATSRGYFDIVARA
jgi:FkbM family methyltransferase